MTSRHIAMRQAVVSLALPGLALLAALLAAPRHAAALTQPNGAAIPAAMGCAGGTTPTGLAAALACVCETAGVCNIGAPCTAPGMCDDGVNGVCETTLWHEFNDNTCIPTNRSGLDPYTEAAITPETFTPACALTFTVITRGTAMFKNAFGWYNVTGTPPTPADLHVMLDCNATAGTTTVLDIVGDPAYAGGEIGFFIATPEAHGAASTCAGGNCCASPARVAAGEGWLYFSQRALNSDSTGPNPYIHLLTLDSHVWDRKFYFAWEDIYGGSNNDFTDLVTSVEGIECAGGGEPCPTGGQGVCGYGVSKCADGVIGCEQLYPVTTEVCDGLDNDCDGVLDDAASCAAAEVCHNGRCVPHCALSSEFDCPPDLACEEATGLCIDPACVGVSCAATQICAGGACRAPCDGIVCPHDQVCMNDACIDPCAGLACAADEVCARGLCVPGCGQCNGLLCGDLACDPSGACVDASCPGGCPAGEYCADGSCHGACEGVVCPMGQVCAGGECGDPSDPGFQDAGPIGGGPDAGIGEDGGGSAGGCGCARGQSEQAGRQALPLLFMATVLFARRRRR